MKATATMPATATCFFEEYRAQYFRLCEYTNAGAAKKILSQIVSLYFLQDARVDVQDLPSHALPATIFRNGGTGILDVFDQYHFSIREENEFAVRPSMLGNVLEYALDTTERKSKGAFYTPEEIVGYMCRESLRFYLDGATPDEGDEKLHHIKVCDPAIGSGAFAIGMLDALVDAQLAVLPYLSPAYLDKKLSRLSLTKSDIEDNAASYSYAIKAHAVQHSLYGMDIDEAAVEITRLRLRLSLLANESIETLTDLDGHIIQRNALLDLPPGWQHSFDIVIGNPPYGIYQGNKKDELETIKKMQRFSMAKGQKLNAFELFLCVAPEISKQDGIIALLFQNSFLADTSSKLLREFYLKNKQVIKIDSFPERDDVHKRVFKSAKMSVCILFAKNDHPTNEEFDLNIWQDRHFENGTAARIGIASVFKLDPLYYSIPSVSQDEYHLLQQLSTCKKLSSIAHCYEGEINLTFQKKYLAAQQCDGYCNMVKGAAIHRWHFVKKMSQGTAEYVSPDYIRDYPRSAKSRHYRHTRLVLQGITGIDEKYRLKFALLNNHSFCGNSANYVLFSDPALTLPYMAVLNSELQNWFFKKYSTNSNVNGYEVDNLPIMDLLPHEAGILSNLATYLMWIANSGDHPTLAAFFETLNNAVNYELFFKNDFISSGVTIIASIGSLLPIPDNMANEEKLAIIQSEFDRLNECRHLCALDTIPAIRIIRHSFA